MTNRRCPSCGHCYNGKRCKNCLYEPFGDIKPSFELHPAPASRWETPTVRRQSPPARPGYPPRSRKQSNTGKAVLKRLGIVWAVIVLLTGFLPVLFEMVSDVGSSFVTAAPEPEPVPLPADGTVIYQDADIQVIADWDGQVPVEGDIPIFVQNFSNKNLIVCTDGVSINGCMTDEVFFYCDAYRNSVSKATLWIDMDTLQDMGFKEVRCLQMAIDVMDDDYNMIMDDAIYDTGGVYVHELDEDGITLYEEEGFRLIYQGWRASGGDTILKFYGENSTGSTMEISGNELLIDGEGTNCWIWQKLLPGAKRVFYLYLHDLAVSDGDVWAEVELFLTPGGDWKQEIYIGPVNFPLN